MIPGILGCTNGLFGRPAYVLPGPNEVPTDPMPVFYSGNLTRPFKVIGVISARGGSYKREKSALYKLKKTAREMGGDALLDFMKGGVEVQGIARSKGESSSSPYHLYSAKVIVFQD